MSDLSPLTRHMEDMLNRHLPAGLSARFVPVDALEGTEKAQSYADVLAEETLGTLEAEMRYRERTAYAILDGFGLDPFEIGLAGPTRDYRRFLDGLPCLALPSNIVLGEN